MESEVLQAKFNPEKKQVVVLRRSGVRALSDYDILYFNLFAFTKNILLRL